MLKDKILLMKNTELSHLHEFYKFYFFESLKKFLLSSNSPNHKSDIIPFNSKKKEGQPGYSINANPTKPTQILNPSIDKKQKSNHREEMKSINEIVSKELSMISGEVSCYCLIDCLNVLFSQRPQILNQMTVLPYSSC